MGGKRPRAALAHYCPEGTRRLVVMAGETNRTNDKGQEEGDKRDGTGLECCERARGGQEAIDNDAAAASEGEREAPRRHARRTAGQRAVAEKAGESGRSRTRARPSGQACFAWRTGGAAAGSPQPHRVHHRHPKNAVARGSTAFGSSSGSLHPGPLIDPWP